MDEFRQNALAAGVAERLRSGLKRPLTLMEVCGTHTVTIFRYGLRQLVPEGLRLLSGPGCPVCVTPPEVVDAGILISREPGCVLATFGDMMRVPGSKSSLEKERARGADVRVVASAIDALAIARAEPGKRIVFFAVGFETTSPTVACTLKEAHETDVRNFFVLPAHKLIPPAMKALLEMGEVKIDGFICPGHVSTIIGSHPYEPLARSSKVPCVVAGFEPLDVLQALAMLVGLIQDGRAEVAIQYRRSVKPEGNRLALERLNEVFEVTDSRWRGLGLIKASGLGLRPGYAHFGAESNFELPDEVPEEPEGCLCGEVLRGVTSPEDCSLFGAACTPDSPVGACMVSSEGTCATHYRYS